MQKYQSIPYQPLIIDQISDHQIQIKENYNSRQWVCKLVQYLHKRQKENKLKKVQSKPISVQTKQDCLYAGGLYIAECQNPLFWKQKFTLMFSHFTFQNLQTLDLANTNLNNCEFLSFIQMPVLADLQLNNNKITNFKSLIKMNIPQHLEYFNLGQNLAAQIKLQRWNLSKLKLQSVQIMLSSEFQVVNQDLSNSAKIETRQKLPSILPDQSDLDQQQRIEQEKTNKAIWDKFYANLEYLNQQQQQQKEFELQIEYIQQSEQSQQD